MKVLQILLALAAIAYVAVCAVLYFYQDRLLFFPTVVDAAKLDAIAREEGFEPWKNLHGDRIGWKSKDGDPRNALLICHGNGGFALGRNYARLRKPTAAGDPSFQIFLLEYPGYGARKGKISAQSFVSAAIDAIDTLNDDPQSRIWLMGQSLGSGVVCAAAVARPLIISGIVLVTPFDSLSSAASAHYPWLPVRLLLRHQLDSDRNLATYHGPIAFVVAGSDTTIPPRLGTRLYDGYNGPKRLWLVPGAGHNDFDELLADWPAISTWLRSAATLQPTKN